MKISGVREGVGVTLLICFLAGPLVIQLWAGERGGGGATRTEQTSPAEKPVISFDAIIHNAGEVWEGDVVTHDFIVRNTGTAQLLIGGVKPG